MNKETNQQKTSYTLNSWLQEWLVTYKQCSVKKSTYNIYNYVVSLVEQTKESKVLLVNATEPQLQKILNSLYKQNYSKSTICKVRYTLRQCFSAALRLHYIDENPSEFLILPDAPTKKILPLTADQQIIVENACDDDPLGYLIVFLLRTGLRRAELINLQWKDYNCITKVISITKSKTEAGMRTIELVEDAQKIIDDQPHINDYIFNSTRKTPLTNTVMRKLYQRLRIKTGIMRLTNHVCRHTFVTRLCEEGVTPKAIAQIIGHAKTDYVMDIYVTIEQKQLGVEIHKLEKRHAVTNRKSKGDNNVILPPAIYNIATSCADASGITVEAFIAQLMVDSIRTSAEKDLNI